MFLEDWKDYFNEKTLKKGFEYYKANAVMIYDFSKNHVEAKIAGSDFYWVTIDFKDYQ